jgi:hypothetical protein
MVTRERNIINIIKEEIGVKDNRTKDITRTMEDIDWTDLVY